ncbi:MAG: FHA domain-containing protein [Kiritimatiellia bacterium]
MSYQLRFTAGPNQGQVYPLDKPIVRIGRASTNDIVVKDLELSRNHCQIEQRENGEFWVADLASANQTFIGEEAIESARLLPGVEVTIGCSAFLIEASETGGAPAIPPSESTTPEPHASPENIDLGFETPTASADTGKNRTRAILWPVVLLAGLCSIIILVFWASGLLSPQPVEEEKPSKPKGNPGCELIYERVDIDADHAFRYAVHLTPDGVLTLKMNDIAEKSRTIDQSKKITVDERNRLLSAIRAILVTQRPEVQDIGQPDNSTHWSEVSLTLVENYAIESCRLQNRTFSEAWLRIKEQIETHCNTLFGTWALNLSADELLAKAKENYNIAIKYDGERGLALANLSNAIRAYSEAIYYMDALDPRPEFYSDATQKKSAAESELQQLCNDHNINAVRAINIKDWETAKVELRAILELVPDRADSRNQAAASKLVEVEARIRQQTNTKR